MQRRKLAALVAGAALALAPCTSAWSADTFPSKPLRLIVGFAPGGGDKRREAHNYDGEESNVGAQCRSPTQRAAGFGPRLRMKFTMCQAS